MVRPGEGEAAPVPAGGRSFEDPLLFGPHAIAVDSQGLLYVGEVAQAYGKTERGTRAIQKFVRAAGA